MDKITNHVEQAKDRLIEQYKNSENLIGTLKVFTEGTQELEDALYSLLNGRWVDQAEGTVLDDFGTIVGQDRLGYDDDFYRLLIYMRIGKNISEGEPERVISVYKIITQATLCFLEEHYPAGLILLSNGQIDPISAKFIYEQMQDVVGAGIRIDQLGLWDDAQPFAFAGFPNAHPFGDGDNDPNGGIFAYLLQTKKDFGFLGASDTDGFGTLDDHVYGGVFSTAI